MMEGEGHAIFDAAFFQDIFNGIDNFAVTRVNYRCNRMGGSLISNEVLEKLPWNGSLPVAFRISSGISLSTAFFIL